MDAQVELSAWLPTEPVSAVMATGEACRDAMSVLDCISAWLPQQTAALTKCTPEDRISAILLNSEQANRASIGTWLPASNAPGASVNANFDGADSDAESILSRLTAWLPQTTRASSGSAPKLTVTHRRAKPLVLPKLHVPLPAPLRVPLLPGQCEIELDPLASPRWRPEQSLAVRTSPSLSATAALASEKYSSSVIRTREGKVGSPGVSTAGGGGGGEGAPSAGKAAMGGGMQLEPLPKLIPARRTRD